MPIDELGLVERLKAGAIVFAGKDLPYASDTMSQAAAAIERLLAERDEAREALRPFAEGSIDVSGTAVIGVTRHDLASARQALEGKP